MSHSENIIHSQNTNWIIKTTKNIVQKLSLKVYAWSSLTSIYISTSFSNSCHSLEAVVFMWLLQSNLSLWTPPYYRQFFWSQKCQKSYIPYLLNMHTSVNRTLSWFCPVGVGIKEVWLYLIRKTTSFVNSHVEFHYNSQVCWVTLTSDQQKIKVRTVRFRSLWYQYEKNRLNIMVSLNKQCSPEILY